MAEEELEGAGAEGAEEALAVEAEEAAAFEAGLEEDEQAEADALLEVESLEVQDAEVDDLLEEESLEVEGSLEVQDHLKDSVDGSFRLKRLLEQDAADTPAAKRKQAEADALLEVESLEVQEAEVDDLLEEESLEVEGSLEVQEHLKDSVDGSFRLKRLLEQDDADTPAAKRKKVLGSDEGEEHAAIVDRLLLRWAMKADALVRHVLTSVSLAELKALAKTSYVPDKSNTWKSAAELLQRHFCERRERTMVSGGPLDCIGAFRHRWRLDHAKEKQLRGLTHKELRHMLNEYNGTRPFDDVIAEASQAVFDEDEHGTEGAVPNNPGCGTVARFQRLELVDPFADTAIFGDANLTFALKLARHRKALGHVGRVIATTFEELETLRERYHEIDESIKVLEDHFAEVYHGVDCTRVAVDPRFGGLENSLGGVYYNFPHSGAIQGFFDGHPVVNWRHENLMRLFFRALRSFVKERGIVKVSSNMGAVGVRYAYIVGSAIENEFVHVETMPFLEWHLHRYGRSYGDKRDAYKRPDAKNNQSYNSQRAEADMVYCFRYEPSGETLPPQLIRLPPSLRTLMACRDGPFKNLTGQAKKNLAQQLHQRFVKEVSGTHVG